MVPNVWQINISTRFHHPESNRGWKTSKKKTTFPVLGTGKQAVGLQKLNVAVTQHKPPEGEKSERCSSHHILGKGDEVSREMVKLTQNSPLCGTEDEWRERSSITFAAKNVEKFRGERVGALCFLLLGWRHQRTSVKKAAAKSCTTCWTPTPISVTLWHLRKKKKLRGLSNSP